MKSVRGKEQKSVSVRPTAVRLLVLLVLWSHVSHAAHQFEHDLDDFGEHCSMCAQFERCGDAIPVAAIQVQHTLPSALGECQAHSSGVFAAIASPYLSRAPPNHLNYV